MEKVSLVRACLVKSRVLSIRNDRMSLTNARPISNQEDIRPIFLQVKRWVRQRSYSLCLSSIIARSGTYFQYKVQ
jgi:hypothetical protein